MLAEVKCEDNSRTSQVYLVSAFWKEQLKTTPVFCPQKVLLPWAHRWVSREGTGLDVVDWVQSLEPIGMLIPAGVSPEHIWMLPPNKTHTALVTPQCSNPPALCPHAPSPVSQHRDRTADHSLYSFSKLKYISSRSHSNSFCVSSTNFSRVSTLKTRWTKRLWVTGRKSRYAGKLYLRWHHMCMSHMLFPGTIKLSKRHTSQYIKVLS